MRLLLGWPDHAPRADCQDGKALILAAEGGHEEVLQVLRESVAKERCGVLASGGDGSKHPPPKADVTVVYGQISTKDLWPGTNPDVPIRLPGPASTEGWQQGAAGQRYYEQTAVRNLCLSFFCHCF